MADSPEKGEGDGPISWHDGGWVPWTSDHIGGATPVSGLEVTVDDFSLWDVFWTMLWFFLFIAWLWLLITLIGDLVRDRTLSGWAKAGWAALFILLPLIGVLAYLVFRGSGMVDRAAEEAGRRDEALKTYVRDVAGTGGGASVADELVKLAGLRDSGTISDEEFAAQKAKLLA